MFGPSNLLNNKIALQHATACNPDDSAPVDALIDYLIESGEDSRASYISAYRHVPNGMRVGLPSTVPGMWLRDDNVATTWIRDDLKSLQVPNSYSVYRSYIPQVVSATNNLFGLPCDVSVFLSPMQWERGGIEKSEAFNSIILEVCKLAYLYPIKNLRLNFYNSKILEASYRYPAVDYDLFLIQMNNYLQRLLQILIPTRLGDFKRHFTGFIDFPLGPRHSLNGFVVEAQRILDVRSFYVCNTMLGAAEILTGKCKLFTCRPGDLPPYILKPLKTEETHD